MERSKKEAAIVLFDGDCNLCDGVVQFLLLRDKTGDRFRFASLQSDAGQKIFTEHGGQSSDLSTMAVYADGKLYTHSDAALQLAQRLPFPWPLFTLGLIIPRPIRDALYRFVAANRYRWFGKRESCLIPTPERKARFLT